MQEYEDLFGVSTSSKTKSRTPRAEEESSTSTGLALDLLTVDPAVGAVTQQFVSPFNFEHF